jgi:hypothetical protein
MDSECQPYDLGLEKWTYIRLHRAEGGVVRRALDGTRIIGGVTYEAGQWHQPEPRGAFLATRRELLRINARREDAEGDPPLCIDALAVHAAPFSPLAKEPRSADLVTLPVYGTSEDGAPSIEFEAPTAPGEWVIRVVVGFETVPGPTQWEAFFRVLVDVPRPTVDGTATAPVACGQPGEGPPSAFISVDGKPWVEAERGSTTWRRTAADGFPPNGARVDADVAARLVIRTEDDICAAWWQIQLAPVQKIDYRYREPITDLVPNTINDYYDEAPGAANRFHLAAIPRGDWVVEASFWFARERDRLIGQTTHYWHIKVD